jgi:hypothetical protein
METAFKQKTKLEKRQTQSCNNTPQKSPIATFKKQKPTLDLSRKTLKTQRVRLWLLLANNIVLNTQS